MYLMSDFQMTFVHGCVKRLLYMLNIKTLYKKS